MVKDVNIYIRKLFSLMFSVTLQKGVSSITLKSMTFYMKSIDSVILMLILRLSLTSSQKGNIKL